MKSSNLDRHHGFINLVFMLREIEIFPPVRHKSKPQRLIRLAGINHTDLPDSTVRVQTSDSEVRYFRHLKGNKNIVVLINSLRVCEGG